MKTRISNENVIWWKIYEIKIRGACIICIIQNTDTIGLAFTIGTVFSSTIVFTIGTVFSIVSGFTQGSLCVIGALLNTGYMFTIGAVFTASTVSTIGTAFTVSTVSNSYPVNRNIYH